MPPFPERPLDRTHEDVVFRILFEDWPLLISRLGWFEDANRVRVKNQDGSVDARSVTVDDILHLLAGGGHVTDEPGRWAASFGPGGIGTTRIRQASLDATLANFLLELQARAIRDEAVSFEAP